MHILSADNIPDTIFISTKMQNLGIFISLTHRNACVYRNNKFVTLLLINFKQFLFKKKYFVHSVCSFCGNLVAYFIVGLSTSHSWR
jgi:hypothetical protein